MQDLLTSCFTPHFLVQPHLSMVETPCTWNTSGVKLHGIFSQRAVRSQYLTSIRKHMSRMCACLHELRYFNFTIEYSPEGNRCWKLKVGYLRHHKIPRLCFKEPLKRITMYKYICTHNWENIPFFWYQIWVFEPLLLCAYYRKSWDFTGNYLGSWAATYQYLREKSIYTTESVNKCTNSHVYILDPICTHVYLIKVLTMIC